MCGFVSRSFIILRFRMKIFEFIKFDLKFVFLLIWWMKIPAIFYLLSTLVLISMFVHYITFAYPVSRSISLFVFFSVCLFVRLFICSFVFFLFVYFLFVYFLFVYFLFVYNLFVYFFVPLFVCFLMWFWFTYFNTLTHFFVCLFVSPDLCVRMSIQLLSYITL